MNDVNKEEKLENLPIEEKEKINGKDISLKNSSSNESSKKKKHRLLRKKIKAKLKIALGKTLKIAGKAAKKVAQLIKKAGETIKKAGKSLMETGKGLCSSGLGAIAGVPMIAAGAAMVAAGSAIIFTAKGLDFIGRNLEKIGQKLESRGNIDMQRTFNETGPADIQSNTNIQELTNNSFDLKTPQNNIAPSETKTDNDEKSDLLPNVVDVLLTGAYFRQQLKQDSQAAKKTMQSQNSHQLNEPQQNTSPAPAKQNYPRTKS